MGGLRSAAVAALLGVLSFGCDGGSDWSGAPPATPTEPAAPAFSVYGLGDVIRSVPHPCPAAGSRQFDFWVGQWNVSVPPGSQIATSIISSDLDGCAIMEDYRQNGGFQGRSMSVYDQATGRWYQTFVDNVAAASFRLSGGLEGDRMVMTGSQPVFSFATGTVRQRDVTVTWSPLDGGRVNQRFLTSFDGAPATITFDGTYLPATELTRAPPWTINICRNNAEFRQLDFWKGEWRVSAAQGPELGTSRVTTDLNDCLVQEDFETPKGYRSRSYLYFDFVVEKWFRTFADNTGTHRELSGNLSGDAMVMTGDETVANGKSRALRVTIAPDGANGVRQRWEISESGATGRDELTLVYRK